jgi:hypothetical protein
VSAGDWRERCLQAEQENARLAADLKLYKDRLAAEAAEMRVSELEGAVGVLQSQRHYEQDRAEQAEQQRDAAHAALEKFGGHAEMCPRSARVVHCRLVADPDDVDDFITKRFYSRSEQPCTCGFDAALAASAPQKEQK